MTHNKIQNSKFKLGKSVLLLFLFQMLFNITVAASLYVFTYLIKLLPASIGDNNSLGLFGIILGSQYFGHWMEKKYPGMLDEKRIKKISLLCIMINSILILLGFSILLYTDYNVGKPVDLSGLVSVIVMLFIIMMTMYFGIKYFIFRGIKNCQRRKAELQLKN